MANEKYHYQFHDWDEWITVDSHLFVTAEAAKRAGIAAGFEYVRVIKAPS